MKKREEEEIRWQVVKAILEEFPEVREKVKDYIEKHYKSKGSASKLGS